MTTGAASPRGGVGARGAGRPPVPLGRLVAALGTVYVVWGSTYLAIRIVVAEAPPLTSMGLRYLSAGVVLAAMLALRRGVGVLRLTPRQLLGTGLLGLLLPLLGNGVVSVAESRGITSGYAALLIAMTPLAIVVYRVLDGDRPRPLTLLGVFAGFAGLAVLVLLGQQEGGRPPLGPALLVLLAASCWGFGSYIQPRLWLPEDVFVVTAYEMLLGGALLVLAGLATGERFTAAYSASTWWALAYLVVFGSLLAFTAYVWLVSRAPISLVATYAYVNPVIAVLLGWLVLDERVSAITLLGGGIVVGAVAVVITSERRPEVAPPEPAPPPTSGPRS